MDTYKTHTLDLVNKSWKTKYPSKYYILSIDRRKKASYLNIRKVIAIFKQLMIDPIILNNYKIENSI